MNSWSLQCMSIIFFDLILKIFQFSLILESIDWFYQLRSTVSILYPLIKNFTTHIAIICVFFTLVIRIFSLICVGPPWWTIHRTFGRKVSHRSHFDLHFQNCCYFGQGTIYNLPLLKYSQASNKRAASFIDFPCLLNWVFPVFTEHLLFWGKCSG